MKKLYHSSIILAHHQSRTAPENHNRQAAARDNMQGFSLIELIVTVGIIGILAAIAIPAYSAYTKRAKVSDGLTTLKSAAHIMELDYTNTSVYQCNKNSWSSEYFSYECSASANGFTITANGLGNIANYSYSINAEGERKTLAHPAGPSSTCWRISNTC